MVVITMLRSLNGYINKAPRDSAPKLHKLFNNNAPFRIPTARELILEKLTWFKWFDKEYSKDMVVGFDEDAEMQELCKLINVDWQDLDVSVIDDFLANKQQRCLNGEMLTFKDFKFKS